MAQDAERPDLRRAYREAWATRVATGDISDAVLLRRLHLHGLFLDAETSGGLSLVLGFWHRGVTPRRLTWEIAKECGRAAGKVGRAYWSIAQAFRGVGFEKPVPFDPLLESQELSRLLRETGTVDPEGDGAFDVWFDVRSAPEPRALVLLNDVVIGRATLPAGDWTDLRARADDGRYADGTLDVREDDGLLLVVGLSYSGVTDHDLDDDEDEDD